MDVASIAIRFLCAAVLGFGMMGLFGVQALVGICSSIPLAHRRKKQEPDFDLSMALGRIARHAVIGFLCMAVISGGVIWFTEAPGTFGYLLGAILSFLKNLNRMTPNNRRNQRRFEKLFADCYPSDEDEEDEF